MTSGILDGIRVNGDWIFGRRITKWIYRFFSNRTASSDNTAVYIEEHVNPFTYPPLTLGLCRALDKESGTC